MNQLNEMLKIYWTQSQFRLLHWKKGWWDPNIMRDCAISNECYWYQGTHSRAACWFKDVVCSFCKKMEHIARHCRAKKCSVQNDAYKVTDSTSSKCDNCGLMKLFCGFVVYIRLCFLYLCWTVVRHFVCFVICCKLYYFFVVIKSWSNITNWRRGSWWSYTRGNTSAFVGTVGKFQQEQEDWTQYCDRLEYYFQANEITDENKKKSIFLVVIGPTSLKLLRNLVGITR